MSVKQLLIYYASQGLTIELLATLSDADKAKLIDHEGHPLTEQLRAELEHTVRTNKSKTISEVPPESQALIEELKEKNEKLQLALDQHKLGRNKSLEVKPIKRKHKARSKVEEKPKSKLYETGWQADFCKCLDNVIMCMFAWCLPCGGVCMQAVGAKFTLKDANAPFVACLCALCLCCFGAGYNRTSIRRFNAIEGSYLRDCLLHCCCGVCALTQEWQHVMKTKKGSHKHTICSIC
jgi:Cys-rich protein (TIGR01571 family)